jgi:ERCC4-type nuclease
VLEILQASDGVSAKTRRLALGDYEVDRRILIERKTLSDLAESIKDGRLFSQACRLANGPLRCLMILEGDADSLKFSGMRREAIQGALISLSVFMGIPLLRSRDSLETARLIFYTAHQARAAASGALPRGGKRPRGKRRIQHYILQGLPGVGPGRARSLLKAFGSVDLVFAADHAALQSIEGIGPITAQRICWAIR